MKSVFLLIIISFQAAALVPQKVKDSERLFVNQKTPFWCWAAMSEALYGYYHPEDYKTQESIALKLPNAVTPDHVEIYNLPQSRILFPGTYDYLLDTVLTSDKYKSRAEFFETRKVVSLLDSNNPVMISHNMHVMMIYGYFKIGGEVFLLLYDPNAWAFYSPSTKIVSANMFDPVWNSQPNLIIYLESKPHRQ